MGKRVRMQNFLKIPDGEYDLIQFYEHGHWVVRDDHGDIYSEEWSSPSELVEVLRDGTWIDASGLRRVS